ncbi:MAG: cytidylate kinase family protein [Nanoarchaeota archaeon]|nr:cytidylate kinase family protein [Nanoarchaeota archaeon]
MIITISGLAGSGKSTAAKLLAKKLDYKHYSIGDMRGEMAKERGMSLEEFNMLGEKEAFTDKEVDDYLKNVLGKQDNLVIDGRLGFFFIPHSVKIFLIADLEERARRVFSHERVDEHFESVEAAKKSLQARERSDTFRYQKYYHVDWTEPKHFDLIVDTTHIQPEETLEKILTFLKKKGTI